MDVAFSLVFKIYSVTFTKHFEHYENKKIRILDKKGQLP